MAAERNFRTCYREFQRVARGTAPQDIKCSQVQLTSVSWFWI